MRDKNPCCIFETHILFARLADRPLPEPSFDDPASCAQDKLWPVAKGLMRGLLWEQQDHPWGEELNPQGVTHLIGETDASRALVEQQQPVGSKSGGVGVVTLCTHVPRSTHHVQGDDVQHSVHRRVQALPVQLLHVPFVELDLCCGRNPEICRL